MSTITKERQFHATLFQRKMNKLEIESKIRRLEKKFKKAEKYDDVSAWFDLQDELGVMYNRLMNMQRRINKSPG